MTTAYTSLLGLALPVTGELSGTWGDTVNNYITNYLDAAVAGSQTLSTDADVTLTKTTATSLGSTSSQYAIILCTGARTVLRTITVPAASKYYVISNDTTGGYSVKVVGAGPTTGVTITNGEKALIAWTGADFVKVSSTIATPGGSTTQVQFNNAGVLGGSASLTWDGTYLTAGSIKNSALTSTRITFAGASGLLSDSSSLTWSGTVLSTTGFTASSDSSFTSTGALLISKGTTAQQPTPATGMLRYNTTTNQFEGYSGASPAWNPVGGASISNDTSTSSNLYPVFASATSGTATTVYTSNAKYLYKPSTGELSVSVPVASNGIVVNATTLVSSYTIPSGYSAESVGGTSGFTIPSGLTVTVSSGSRWVVL